MVRIDYRKEKFQEVSVCGIPCDFSNMRIDRSTVPKGRYQYEVADDDESQGEPSRVSKAWYHSELLRNTDQWCAAAA